LTNDDHISPERVLHYLAKKPNSELRTLAAFPTANQV